MSVTATIIRHVQSLGFIVKEFRVNGTVEFHAVPLDGSLPQIARCNDEDDDDAEYFAACMLGEAVGIDLEDG